MSDQATGDNFEDIIRRALAPVDPPEGLAQRLETTLWNLTELAVDELESWELSSMRDPRNWVRPVAAIAIGTAAGAGLIVLGWWRHQQRQKRSVRAAVADPRRIVKR
jgi:ferric-dicitrate binding protein FerR (iron transport regulator)